MANAGILAQTLNPGSDEPCIVGNAMVEHSVIDPMVSAVNQVSRKDKKEGLQGAS